MPVAEVVVEDRVGLVAVLDGARAGGAKAAEVMRVESAILEQAGSRQRPVTSDRSDWAVRVYREGGATGVGTGADPRVALMMALAHAEQAQPDALAGPAERMAVRAGALGTDDRRHSTISDEDRGEVLHLAERSLDRSAGAIRSLLYRQARARRSWMSTRGVEAEEFTTTYSLATAAMLGDLEVSAAISSRHFSDVASLPFGADVRKRLDALSVPLPLPDVRLPLVLEPRVVAELARSLAPCFVATAPTFVAQWHDRALAGPAFHLTDDAGLFGGLYTCAFDDRGVPPIAVALLKEGVVNGLYHDPESARAVGLRPTGHVRGDGLRPANLVVRPGSRTKNVIVSDLHHYLTLDRMPPLDVVAGRWRGNVPVVLCEKHERRGSARATVDWSVSELLHAIRELASDQERVAEVDAPSMVLDVAVG